ncbi:hypothetical protein [Streptomyces hypolithicus]
MRPTTWPRVAQTGGVETTGTWQSLPDADFALTVREQDGVLVYRWTLKSGRKVPAGEHVFAGQHNHATDGRDANDDTYEARARTADGAFTVRGDFKRTA